MITLLHIELGFLSRQADFCMLQMVDMEKRLLAKKIEMSQIFDEEGRVVPITILEALEKLDDESVIRVGDLIKISGTSKGKGFQGVVRRHGFHGAPKTHGTKHAHRQPGSIGATWPQRVLKGTRMPGRMGGTRITVRNLMIAKIDKDKNRIYLKGAVPGARNSLIEIRK